MLMVDVPSFPIEGHLHDLPGLEQRFASWAASLACPIRLLIYSRPFDMTPAIERLDTGWSGAVRQLYPMVQPLLHALLPIDDTPPSLADPALSPIAGHPSLAVTRTWQRRMQGSSGRRTVPLTPPSPQTSDWEHGDHPPPWVVWASFPALQQARLTEVLAPTGLLELALDDRIDTATRWASWQSLGDALRQLIWPIPLIAEQRRLYETLQQQAAVRSVRCVLMAWPTEQMNSDALVANLAATLRQPVRPLEGNLPPILEGEYMVDEWHARLVPNRPGLPYLATLHSYDARGRIDARVLHPLLDMPFDVTVALDITTLPRHTAMGAAELAHATAKALHRDASVKDVGAERKLSDAERVMHALHDQQALHEVQVAVLVSGATAEELDQHVGQVSGAMGASLRFTRLGGAQQPWLSLFTATPARQIPAPFTRRNYLSPGVGCLLGVLGYHRANETRGLLWGLDDVRRSPIFYNPFGAHNDKASHITILGKTRFGKTFFMNVMSMRAAALEGHRVIWIDAYENGVRLARAVGAGGACYGLGLDATINLLDIVFSPEDDGPTWIASQVQHVLAQLALLMGDSMIIQGADGQSKKQLVPRSFSLAERGALDRALSDLYATVDPMVPRAQMPILSDLIEELESNDEPAATELAYDLRMLLFGSSRQTQRPTTMGLCFNGPTSIDWSLRDDVTCFDFSAVEKGGAGELLPFFYSQAIGAIYRDMRSSKRDRMRKTFLFIDEFGLAAQIESVGQLAATMTKVAGKFGYAMVVADQNPATMLNSPYGRTILENASVKILFHLDDLPARQMGEAISDLTPVHVDYIAHAEQGKCVAVFNNTVYAMSVQASALELRALRGS